MGKSTSGTDVDLVPILLTGLLTLPSIQRHYVWGLDKLSHIWESCFEDFQMSKTKIFCFGLIIFYKEEGEEGVWYVYDGQQRLITYFLELASMHYFLRQLYPPEQIETELSRIDQLLFFGNKHRLTLPGKEGEDLARALGTRDNIGKPLTIEKENPILEAKAYFDKIFKKLSIDMEDVAQASSLKSLANFLLNQISVHYKCHDDRMDAVRSFIRINMTVKSLSPADIAKAEVIGRVPLEDQQEAARLWLELEQETLKLGIGKHVSTALGAFLVAFCRVYNIDKGIFKEKLGAKFVENYVKLFKQEISLKTVVALLKRCRELKALCEKPHVRDLFAMSKQRYVLAIIMGMTLHIPKNQVLQKRVCKAIIAIFEMIRDKDPKKGLVGRRDHDTDTQLNAFVREWLRDHKPLIDPLTKLERWLENSRNEMNQKAEKAS
jgi:hypothetical protein